MSNQLGDPLSHGRLGVLFSIGVATAFLSFVAATVTILESLALWWVTAVHLAIGIAILVFVWELGRDRFDWLHKS